MLTGEIPAPDGAPTVLLYGHYDVVGAGDEDKWDTPPFEATERDGAIYGRGTADSKSNVLAHLGALRAWEGKPPVGIRLVIEGQEEIGSALSTFPPSRPELFACDAMVIGDMGSLRPGVPTLTVALRGMAGVIVEVRTLAGPKHSGQFGGAAPDALLVLLHALAALHDEQGRRRRAGLAAGGVDRRVVRRGRVSRAGGGSARGSVLRDRCLGRARLVGAGAHRHRYRRAAGRSCAQRGRAVRAGEAELRLHPEQDPSEGQAALLRHLQGLRPFGIALEVEAAETGKGFAAKTSGPAYDAARAALASAWGTDTQLVATGGSIPLVSALAEAVPDAEILLLGTTDGFANIQRRTSAFSSTSSRRQWSPKPSSSAATRRPSSPVTRDRDKRTERPTSRR